MHWQPDQVHVEGLVLSTKVSAKSKGLILQLPTVTTLL